MRVLSATTGLRRRDLANDGIIVKLASLAKRADRGLSRVGQLHLLRARRAVDPKHFWSGFLAVAEVAVENFSDRPLLARGVQMIADRTSAAKTNAVATSGAGLSVVPKASQNANPVGKATLAPSARLIPTPIQATQVTIVRIAEIATVGATATIEAAAKNAIAARALSATTVRAGTSAREAWAVVAVASRKPGKS